MKKTIIVCSTIIGMMISMQTIAQPSVITPKVEETTICQGNTVVTLTAMADPIIENYPSVEDRLMEIYHIGDYYMYIDINGNVINSKSSSDGRYDALAKECFDIWREIFEKEVEKECDKMLTSQPQTFADSVRKYVRDYVNNYGHTSDKLIMDSITKKMYEESGDDIWGCVENERYSSNSYLVWEQDSVYQTSYEPTLYDIYREPISDSKWERIASLQEQIAQNEEQIHKNNEYLIVSNIKLLLWIVLCIMMVIYIRRSKGQLLHIRIG
jgi:hypothetical protein